jgi:hypothetical protein
MLKLAFAKFNLCFSASIQIKHLQFCVNIVI